MKITRLLKDSGSVSGRREILQLYPSVQGKVYAAKERVLLKQRGEHSGKLKKSVFVRKHSNISEIYIFLREEITTI